MLALVSIALAAPGFWHPSDVARGSRAFAEGSDRSMAGASGAQDAVRAMSVALADYEEALDLLGPAAPAAEREQLDAMEKAYNRDHAVLQAFADALVGDFDLAFGDAIERALAGRPDAVRCEREIPDGPSLPGMRMRTKANPDCVGEDLNDGLAKALDADPVLKARLDEVLSRAWPVLDVPTGPVPPIGGAGRWVGVAPFWNKAAPRALRDIRRADEDARVPFEAAIEQGADTEAKRALVAEAKAVDAATAAGRAALAAPVHARAAAVLAKKAPDVGWCARPAAIGGCEGADATGEIASMLLADKKLLRLLP